MPSEAAKNKTDRPALECRPGDELSKVEPGGSTVGIAAQGPEQPGRRGDGFGAGSAYSTTVRSRWPSSGKCALDLGRRLVATELAAGLGNAGSPPDRPSPAAPAPARLRQDPHPVGQDERGREEAISPARRGPASSQTRNRLSSRRVASSFPRTAGNSAAEPALPGQV